MPLITQRLPNLVMTSSAVDTSTQTITAVDISDAQAISAIIQGNTTAPGLILQVALTTESTAAFGNLVYQSTGVSNNYYLTSGAVVYIPVAAMQARLASSNVTSTGYTLIWNKQVHT